MTLDDKIKINEAFFDYYACKARNVGPQDARYSMFVNNAQSKLLRIVKLNLEKNHGVLV